MGSQTLWQRLPRCSLWDLLDDMLMPVLELLSPPELHALSLVSKVSRASCEPLPYSSIEWTWLEDRPPPIAAFIRTILRRPELAAHVRSVSLLGDSFIPYHEERDTIPPRIDIAALDYKGAVKVIEQTKVDFALSWKKELSQGAMDALTTLLLSQFNICGSYFLPFFYLPVVQEFSVVSSMPMWWGEWLMQAPTSSVLTMLHLTAIEPKHLGHLLSMTPVLKRLRYDWYYRSGVDLGRPEEGSVWVSLDDIGRALEHVRETLEELVITGKCSIEAFHEYDFLDFEGTLKGIVDFGRLTTLQIPLPFLTGNFDARHAIVVEDVIPRNLEILTITDDVLLEWPWQPEWEDTAVSSALGRWLRNLKWVKTRPVLHTLVLKEVVKEWSPVMKEELSHMCHHYGLEFRVTGF